MKKNALSLLLILPLLASCGGGGSGNTTPIEDYVPELPEFKDKNVGAIRTDGTYDYIDIYELSDFHGAVLYDHDDKEIGITRLGGYFNKKRESNPGGTVIISGGDMWQGSADSNLTRGNMVTYSMDVIGFDAMTMGNHEFDWGKSWQENNKTKANFPFLAANIFNKDSGERDPFFDASKIINRGDYKIGIIGTIGDDIRDSIIAKNIVDYTFEKERDTVISESIKLREAGCDLVIWSTHNDAEEIYSTDVAALGVDAIFGAHTHTNYSNKSGLVPILQTKAYGKSVAHAELKINKSDKKVADAVAEIDETLVDQNLPEDADIKMIQDQYNRDFIDSVKSTWIAKTDNKLTIEKTLSNYCVYSMQEYVKASGKFNDYPITAAFHNQNGGVRKDIDAGDIRYGDVYVSFPFDNEIVIAKVKGDKLKNMFIVGNTCVWHNLYDESKKSFKDVDDSQTYYVLITDFLETNKQYFDGMAEEVTKTELLVRDGVAETMKKAGNIKSEDFESNMLRKRHMEFVNPYR